MGHLLPDVALAGAALEEELAGFGVFRQQVSLVVDELEGATVAGGSGLAAVMVSHALTEVCGVAGVEIAVPETAEDVDVVHVLVSDAGRGGCLLLRGLLASAIHTSGPVKSALRARPRASRKRSLLRSLLTCLRPGAKPRDKEREQPRLLPFPCFTG